MVLFESIVVETQVSGGSFFHRRQRVLRTVQLLWHEKSVYIDYCVIHPFSVDKTFFIRLAVLTLYLRDVLLYDENESTVWYHLFSMLCYFTPVFGAILADTYLGKFRYTIIQILRARKWRAG